MVDTRHEGVPALRPLLGLMDGLHGAPLTCVCTVICSAKGGCSSCRQFDKAHLLGLHQPSCQHPRRREEGLWEGWGRTDTERRTEDPTTATSLGPGLTQRVALTVGYDAVSGGTMDMLCDCGLVT